MKIRDLLFNLSALDSIGSVTEAQEFVFDYLSKYLKPVKTDDNNIIAHLKGKSDYTVMLDSHIDQVGFVVTNVDDNGFLTVSNVGGIDIRALPSRAVTVHGKEKITAVFCATPPHLASGETEYSDITDIKLDTALGAKAKEIVSLGDYVTFNTLPFELNDNIVCGRSFDDRAGVACLLEVAHRLSEKELPVNVVFSFSSAEELGLRGVRTTAFRENIDEAVAVDVTFGDGVGLSSEESCKLGGGAMIGVSPTLDKALSQHLTKIAKDNGIPHDLEIMASTTGTNADMISISKSGVKTATVSIPLRNMHTDCEILNLKDITAVCDLLEKYILSGGVLNA
jgi:endoglucanase